jgi:hypothetical protein
MQDKMELNGGALVVHHDPSSLSSARLLGCEGVHDG